MKKITSQQYTVPYHTNNEISFRILRYSKQNARDEALCFLLTSRMSRPHEPATYTQTFGDMVLILF